MYPAASGGRGSFTLEHSMVVDTFCPHKEDYRQPEIM